MSRPLRIEFPGAVYHVTSRGDRREPIFDDDADRQRFLGVLAHGLSRFDAQVLAYCLMGNHYHFVLYTRAANLSRLMRHINGVYTQAYNRRHGKVGHLFPGRFKAVSRVNQSIARAEKVVRAIAGRGNSYGCMGISSAICSTANSEQYIPKCPKSCPGGSNPTI